MFLAGRGRVAAGMSKRGSADGQDRLGVALQHGPTITASRSHRSWSAAMQTTRISSSHTVTVNVTHRLETQLYDS